MSLAPPLAMNKTQQTALAASALAVGAALISRALRAARTIDFRGRSVVITGGSRGLGLLVARELGRRGARLTLAARDQGELDRAVEDLSARGIDAAATCCDVTNRDDAESLIAGVVRRTGALDVLINNAGVIQVGPIHHMHLADFDE